MDVFLCFTVLFAALLRIGFAECPDDDPALSDFSDVYTGYENATDIVVDTPVRLNVANLDVRSITIEGASGKLVFKRDMSISVRTAAITIRDFGQFLIGSEDCRHTSNVDIILYGKKSEFPDLNGPEGEMKYIYATNKSTVRIVGDNSRRSWTKIDTTLPRFSDNPANVVYDSRKSDENDVAPFNKGLSTYVVNPDLSIADYTVFTFDSSNTTEAQAEVNSMITTLEGVQSGQLVVVSTSNSFESIPTVDYTPLYTALEQTANIPEGELIFRRCEKYDACTLMFVKDGDYVQKKTDPFGKYAKAQVSLQFGGKMATSTSYIEQNSVERSYVDFRIVEPSITNPFTLTVHDTLWQTGDLVGITSTDYAANHAEVGSVVFSAGQTVLLYGFSDYRHHGNVLDNTDMRAEIALLSRNIKIRAEIQEECPVENGNCDAFPFDSFGGQLKVAYDFEEVIIDGAEIINFGQLGVKGAYPINFDRCGDIGSRRAIVRDCSIHDSFNRAITIRDTRGSSMDSPGVLLKDNVIWNTLGHSVFFEAGTEIATRVEGNLVAGTWNVQNGFFKTDTNEAASFWLTNPKIHFVGNIAGGGDGSGIWYAFPNKAVGLDNLNEVFEKGEAFRTPLWTLDNNAAHSYEKACFQMYKKVLNEHGRVGKTFNYIPRVNPRDKTSELVKAQATRLTTYKCQKRGIFSRGGTQIMQSSSYGGRRQYTLGRATLGQGQFMNKLVAIGHASGEIEEEPGYPDAITPADIGYQVGFESIDGPVYVDQIWMNGYTSAEDGSYYAGGFGFVKSQKGYVSHLTTAKEFKFGFSDPVEGNRLFAGGFGETYSNLGFKYFDGSEMDSMRDLDGSVFGCEPLTTAGPFQVVRPEPFLLTDRCKCRANWNMCGCEDLYAMAKIRPLTLFGTQSAFNLSIITRRIGYDNPLDDTYEDHSHKGGQYLPRSLMVTGDDRYYYQVQTRFGFPKKLQVAVDGLESGSDVVIGVCLPGGTTSDMIKLSGKNELVSLTDSDFVHGENFQAVRDDTTMKTVYFDESARMLYLKFADSRVRDPVFDRKTCIDDVCLKINIKLTEELVYTPCFAATDEQLYTDYRPDLVEALNCTYPSEPVPDGWGAGDFFAAKDGGWSDWMQWAECTETALDVNLAVNATTSQTKDLNYAGFIWYSSLAVDGVKSVGKPEDSRTCSASNVAENEWSVTLDDSYAIKKVVVHGRTDNAAQLSGFTMFVRGPGENDTEVLIYDSNPFYNANNLYTVELESAVVGQVVIIRRSAILTLCEVEVFEGKLTRSRTRLCESPKPYLDGADCGPDNTDTEECPGKW